MSNVLKTSNVFILMETVTNGFYYNILTVLCVISLLCGILVIISKNPIVSVLFLIGLFIGIASYLMLTGINFIGLSYLLVYVGAVSILFLFILMLINVRISELTTETNNSLPLAIFIGTMFGITFQGIIPSNSSVSNDEYDLLFNKDILSKITEIIPSNYFSLNDNSVFFVTSQTWDGTLAEFSHITSIGNVIYTSYPLWLILVSVILLLAMVGAIIISIEQ